MKNAARAVFQNNELLRYLDSAGIDRVVQLATRRSYEQGSAIFTEGDRAEAIYGVISGQVQISARSSSNGEIFLDAYGSGRIFGLISGIDGLLRCTTARAAPTAEVFVICRDQFLGLIVAEPRLSIGLLAVFCQRQRVVTGLIVGEYSQRDIPARLAHRVLELTGVDPSGTSCLDITQAELAKFVFVSRQVVNQYLSEWHSRGWVAKSPRHLRVTDRQALLAVATSAGTGM